MTGIAIVGTGMWAPRLAAAAERAGLRLVTCFSRDEGRRGEFAERFGCDPAESFEAAVEHPDVEGVLLVTPNDVHGEQALVCAERGRHAFVEKPIADTTEAGERMRRACAEAGVTLMVGHAFRRLGAARRVKELIDDGALGRVVLAEANMSLPGRSSRGMASPSGAQPRRADHAARDPPRGHALVLARPGGTGVGALRPRGDRCRHRRRGCRARSSSSPVHWDR